MIIRKAKSEDARRVAEINVIGWHTAYKGLIPDDFLEKWQVTDRRVERFREKIEDPKNTFLVVEEKGYVVGYLDGFKNVEEPQIPYEYVVQSLYIDPDFQRHGAGTALLKAFQQSIGGKPFFLHALKGNEQAMNFYTKLKGKRSPEYDLDRTWGNVTRRIEAFVFV